MDFNILIRTMVKQAQQLNFRTGAGIVYDSIPDNEVEETRHKAKGLLKALVQDIRHQDKQK
jgi:anthranilate synthase component 1